MKLMNKLVDLKGLQQNLLLIFHDWQKFVDFILVFLWITLLFIRLLLPFISLGLFGRRLVMSGSWKTRDFFKILFYPVL